MTRLALGAKWGRPGSARRPLGREQVFAQQRRQRGRADAARRPRRRTGGASAASVVRAADPCSFLRDRLVQVQDQAGDAPCRPPVRPRRACRRAAIRPDVRQLPRRLGIGLVVVEIARERVAQQARSSRGVGGARRGQAERQCRSARRRSPPSFIMRSASLRAASTIRHVVHQVQRLQRRVRARLADRRRPRARRRRRSSSTGGGTVRFQNVYRLRRYRLVALVLHVVLRLGQLLPQPRRLIRLHRRAAELLDQQARRPPAPDRGSSRPAAGTAARAPAAGSRDPSAAAPASPSRTADRSRS